MKPPAPAGPGMVKGDLLSLYAQGRCDLAEGLRFTGGVRHDDSSSYGAVDTPRAGLVYNREKLTLKALYGEAFRAPRPWDYGYGTGNQSLMPERMYSTELSASYPLADSLLADLSVYHNKLTGLLTLSGTRWVNSGAIETRGAEARVEFARGGVKGYAQYALQVSEDAAGADVPEIGRHNAGAGVQFALGRRTRLDLVGRYIGGRKNPSVIAATGGDSVGAAVVADAALTLGAAGGFEAQLAAKNLLDAKYYDTSNRPPDRYRQPQRQFLLQVRCGFGPGEGR